MCHRYNSYFSIGVSFYLRTVLQDLKVKAKAEEKAELMEKHKEGKTEDQKTEEKAEIQTTEAKNEWLEYNNWKVLWLFVTFCDLLWALVTFGAL